MTPKQFLKTIWICEPPKGNIEVFHVEHAMKLYAEYLFKEQKDNEILSYISSRFEFIFHSVAESKNLKNETRALIKDKNGFMQFAVWFKNGGWYDEGSICYSDGIGGEITDVIEFALIKK